MGFRNPFRIQVDENDVAYMADYSPDAQTPQRGRGPAGIGRFEIVRKPSNYGWPTCYKRDLGVLRVELPRVRARHHHRGHAAEQPAAEVRLRRADAAQRLALGTSRAARRRARPDVTSRRSPTRTSGTPTATTTRPRRSARRATAYYAPTPGPIAPGSTTDARGCSRSCTPAASARTVSRSTTTTRRTRTPRSSRRTTTTRSFIGEFDAGHAARGHARQAEPRPEDQQFLNCGSQANAAGTPRSGSSATTRWTCSSAPTATST